jgi:limonene-1,2-epoxide hydrolase
MSGVGGPLSAEEVVRDYGVITGWRDYFDSKEFGAQLSTD